MLRAITKRLFSDHRYLRKLNREMKFDKVKEEFEKMKFSDKEEEKKCRVQYEYAINYTPPSKSETNEKPSYTAPSPSLTPTPEAPFPSIAHPIYIKEIQPAPDNFTRFFSALSIIACGYFLYLLWKRDIPGGSGMLDSSKHIIAAESTNVTFDDVRGIDECREELEEIVDYLKNPDKYHSTGAKMPKGILMTGRPGTGKTLLAKAIAGEANVKFYFNSGSDFEEVFVGLGAKRIRELFKEAKKSAPCIIFIDEIDALGASRKSKDFNYNRQSLNQLLVEMDGFEAKDNILVIGATNYAESLDHALTRAGRFDKVIDIPMPDKKGRTQILDLYLKKVYHDETVTSEKIAKGTVGMTGADLANVVNLAVLSAVKEGRSACNFNDVEKSIDRILMGVERRTLSLTDEEKLNTAIHEVGHALTAVLTKSADPLHKTTILPRGPSLGMTVNLPEKDKVSVNREEILAKIDVAMGGRAAEEIFLGVDNLTTGCSSDLDKATKIAYYYTRGGMFDEVTGLVNFNGLEDYDVEGSEHKDLIDQAVRNILDESYRRTKEKLSKNKSLLMYIAKKLVERETLTSEDFSSLIKEYN